MEFFKLNKNKLSISDLNSINELLKSGLTFKESFELIKTNKNEKIINKIINELNKGILIEKILLDYLPKNIASFLKPLLKVMSFSKSLELSLAFYKEDQDNEKEIEKNLIYPFVLLFVAISGLYLFDNYGLDSIIMMLKSFNNDFNFLIPIRIIFKIIVYLFYFGLIIFVILYFYFKKEKNISIFYLLIVNNFKNSLIHVYFCKEFINLFMICANLGYKTKDILKALKALHNKPIVSLLAFHLEEYLLNGESLKEASKQKYFDETLSKFINVAIYTNDYLYILNNYLLISDKRIKDAIKKMTSFIQIGSYLFIGLIIVFIYQILFLPMQAISNF